ncbi:hypothetical protein JRI60_41835 [Archangium violaceum]|uniref:hypothetical protein n=1 Tax=Archangium violaceum TaxID=83451 RepID=UPI00194F9C2D|nr:hypothetical protein [Archangium violaceum]QRN95538.1 hypothetical protein JRI60_41835 [Archangium violaceum]
MGPYLLREQMPQDEHGRGALYRATNEKNGATALVLNPATVEGKVPLKDWRVRYISSASPNYLALEVEDSRWSVASDGHSVEALVCLFEGVREGMMRMADAFPSSSEPHPWRRLGLVLAGCAVACTLVFALLHSAPASPPPSEPSHVARTAREPLDHEVPMHPGMSDAFTSALDNTTTQEQPGLARPLPREPFKGQKRPPCTRYTEVELVGACWMPHELKAQCPNALFEHQGKCYAPVFTAPPPPQSIEQ